ncbi:MAG: D-aminoacylase, partial [Gammaproteobacteria bacterium]|nr:D-aminoacylase [Gammaproteobacteria bacterium]
MTKYLKPYNKILAYFIRLVLIPLALLGSLSLLAEPEFDLLITNARIVDGTGKAAFKADVGIADGTIAAIGSLKGRAATQLIDANMRVVSPGFIDLHSHDERNMIRRPQAENIIRQGVTTLLTGNCGGSPVDIARYFEQL